MSENIEKNEESTAAGEFSFEESIKVLKADMKKVEKIQEDYKKKTIPMKKNIVGEQEVYEIEKEQLLSLEKQYSMIIGSFFRFVNPVLKKWEIDPLDNTEIGNLSKAILNVSESNVRRQVHKIEKRVKSIGMAIKWVNFLAVCWELGVSRYDQLRASVAKQKALQQGVTKTG